MLDKYNKDLRTGAIRLHSTRTPFYKQAWFKQQVVAFLMTASFVALMIIGMIVGAE